jgi:hypothetical protein
METTATLLADMKDSGLLPKLVKRGVISISFIDYMAIYNSYLDYRKKSQKMDSYTFAAEKHFVSVATVRNIVRTMER